MKKVKRQLCFFLAILMMITLSACASSSSSTATAPGSTTTESSSAAASGSTETKGEPITLKITCPGDRPADIDVLVAAIEEKCPLNVKLNFVFYPHSDIQEKTRLSLATGEENDLVWTSGGSRLMEFVRAGYLENLDTLLNEYGQDILAMRPQQMWDNTAIDGSAYAIPLGTYNRFVMHYNVRADLRKEMGYPEITNMEQLVDFAYKAHEAYPDIPTIVPGAFGGEQYCTWATFPFDGFIDTDLIGFTKWNGGSLMLYIKDNDGIAYNLFDTKEPAIWNRILEARKLYEDGVMYSDVLSLKTYRDQMTLNKAVICPWPEIIPEAAYRNQLAANVPGGEIESVVFWQDLACKPGTLLADFSVWNFQSVASNCKNKEVAIQFLNWTQQKENYDLCAYGIEGVHCELIGDDQYKNISDKMRQFGYAWIWSPVLDRVDATATAEELKYDTWARKGDPNDFVNRIDGGLVFDTSKCETAIAQYSAIEAKYYAPIFNGVVDPEEYFEMFKAEAYEPLKEIQEEVQRQMDEYIQSRS